MRLHNLLFAAAAFVTFILIGTPSCSGWIQAAGVVTVGATLLHASEVEWRERAARLEERRWRDRRWPTEEDPNG